MEEHPYNTVTVRSNSPAGVPTHIWIDDKEIHGVLSIEYSMTVGKLPIFTITMFGRSCLEEVACYDAEKYIIQRNAAKKL